MTIFHTLIVHFYLARFHTDLHYKYLIAKEFEILSVIEICTWIIAFIPSAILTYVIQKKLKYYNLGMFED